ncbi:MAG: OmpH family outer membrane protein [Alistipes sp.]|nr:OmpH family outer membrane protein [Rikenellaceae bacterium]MBQ3148787.1 OmpH family outer membrane protein [Alistipes sp.]MBQ4127444.1 OmpH family outer membrane protein [Alistipes sp.]
MKKIFLAALIATISLAACQNQNTEAPAEAQDAATEQINGGDIAYVRVEYVMAESEIYKTEGVALQEKTEKASKSWAQKEKNLQYEATQLQEKYQKGLITTADAQKQQQNIERKIANYQTNTQKEAKTLEEENIVFTNRTQDLVMRAIREINADKKYKLIVNATALLDGDESLDISAAVLAKVNELYAKEKTEAKQAEKAE